MFFIVNFSEKGESFLSRDKGVRVIRQKMNNSYSELLQKWNWKHILFPDFQSDDVTKIYIHVLRKKISS